MDEESSELAPNEYYVERILDKKVIDGEVRYLIKWDGWSIEESTWEPVDNLDNIKNLIEDFEKEKLKKESGMKFKAGRPPKTEKSEKSKKSSSPKNKIGKENENEDKKEKLNSSSLLKSDVDVIYHLGINIPDEVLSVKKDKEGNFICLVKFKERPDGIIMDNSYVPSSVLKDQYPLLLIKFYESKITFVEKK